ncbi:MAG: OadG family protein [Treponema sp.]|nr:OadG family protein [Treponema sp.]
MTITEMLGQSGILAILGMGVVFGFLWLMVICVSFVGKYFQSKEKKAETVSVSTSTAGVPKEHIAAITAAIMEYEKTH